MNDETRRREVNITLRLDEWCLILGVLNSVIESSIPMAERTVMMQTQKLAHIREIIDRATDL